MMEAVVQILEAEELVPVMYIPTEMRHSRLEVSLRLLKDAAPNNDQTVNTNQNIMQKFLKAAESGEAKESLKKKLAEGTQFDFDAEKIIDGTMTEADWQNLYASEKQVWSQSAARRAVS